MNALSRHPQPRRRDLLVAGAVMIAFAWRVSSVRVGEGAARAARGLFSYSLLYLFVLFAVLLIERGLPGVPGDAAM